MSNRALAGGLSRFAQFAGISRKPKADDAPATGDDIDDVKDDVEEVDDKVDDVQDDVDDLEDRVDDLEGDDEDEEDDQASEEPGDDKPAEQAAFRRGRAAGRKAGRKAERARCDAILTSSAAASNRVLAMHLAFNSSMPAGEAAALLKASAAGAPAPVAKPAKSGLDARMNGTKQVALGSGAAERGVPTTSAELADSAVALARSAGIVK